MNIRAKGVYVILLNPVRASNADAHYYNELGGMFATNKHLATKFCREDFSKDGAYSAVPAMHDIRIVHIGDIIPLNEEEDSE